jgi:hypothetical protein
MKLTYTTRDGRMQVEFEAKTQRDLFEQIASFQEIFEQNTCSAKRNGNIVRSDSTRFVVRESKEGDRFYEKVCDDWDAGLAGYKKSYGCLKKGDGLFPKEMPEKDRVPGLNGWYKFVRDEPVATQPDTNINKEATPF